MGEEGGFGLVAMELLLLLLLQEALPEVVQEVVRSAEGWSC